MYQQMCPSHDRPCVGGYVRHRHRMVLQAIYEDTRRLLLHPFPSPSGQGDPQTWLETDGYETLGLLGESSLTFIDYYPEGGLAHNERVSMNTLALSEGEQSAPSEDELGGGLLRQDYIFDFAFITDSEAVAKALFSDLADRFRGFGRHVDLPVDMQGTFMTLHDYNRPYPGWVEGSDSPEERPTCVTRMELQAYEYARSNDEVPPGTHLYYGRLGLSDWLEQRL